MAAPSPPLAAMVSLATNATSGTGSPLGIPIWYGIGSLGLVVVGFLVWFFLLRKQKD